MEKQLKVLLSSKIADELRNDILLRILKPNEYLNEASLAEKFGVSRGPIRQALVILSNEGIVESLSNGRTKVIGVTKEEMLDYYNMRYFIEAEAIKKILLQPDDANFRNWLESMYKLIDVDEKLINSNYVDTHEIDRKFHLGIIEQSHSQISKQIWKNLFNFNRSILALKKIFFPEGTGDYEITDASHRRILKYFDDRDKDAVLKEMSWHLERSIHVYEEILNISELDKIV